MQNVYLDSITLTYCAGGKERTTTYNGVATSRKEKRANRKKTGKMNRETFFTYDTIRNVALMEINTFQPRNGRFNKVLDAYFDTLAWKRIDTVFIDISCNRGGGLQVEERVASYFVPNGGYRAGSVMWKQSRLLEKTHRLDHWMRRAGGVRETPTSLHNGTYYQEEIVIRSSLTDRKFQGKVYVVQSRHSFSAATLF
ncbi:MAG: S41 family peptidase, partial [Bacteroidales bacterium]|nr:S41 family peptidase [Bacteroidales bacterium]